jgi:hypothetical protein
MAENLLQKKQSDKVFVTPIDHLYHSQQNYISKNQGEEDHTILNDYKDLHHMVDDIVKDCCEDDGKDENESISTNSNSPMDRNMIPFDMFSPNHHFSNNLLMRQIPAENQMKSLNYHNGQSIQNGNSGKKGKLLKTSNFIKKNWKNKLVIFKDVLTKKIMSKFQLYVNNKSKSYGSTPDGKGFISFDQNSSLSQKFDFPNFNIQQSNFFFLFFNRF